MIPMLAVVLIATGEVHTIAVSALSFVAAAALGLFCRLMWRAFRAISGIENHVLPHFMPLSPDEIRAKKVDTSIPARIGRLEDAVVTQRDELSTHLTDESADRVGLNSDLSSMRGSLVSMKSSLASLLGVDSPPDTSPAGSSPST